MQMHKDDFFILERDEFMIEIKNLSKTYHLKDGDVEAIKDVSLNIKDKEVFGIIGYSGAGKSSLIRCINLLEIPDKGEVIVNETPLVYMEKVKKKDQEVSVLKKISDRKLRMERKKIGMIFQHFNLLDRKTVFENIAYPLRYSKRSKEEIKSKVLELLELVDLKDKINVYPSQLSGGQKQRVAIARAIANDPKILLSDESTSALDPEATESILELLKKLNQKLGLTIVLITHEMSVIKTLCHRVAVMEKGSIVEQGNVYDIFANPQQEITKKFVNSTTSLGKLGNMIESKSPLIALKDNEKLIKLQFLKNSVGDALISLVSREFNVNISIVLANVEMLQNSPLGSVVAIIKGEEEKVLACLQYFKNNNVNVEVIENGKSD